MKRYFYTLCVVTTLFLAGLLNPLDCASQESPAGEPQAASAENENPKSLGGFFATTLQDILKNGKFFYPNGKIGEETKEEGEETKEKKYKLSFNNAPIDQVLKFMTDITNKVVMRTDQVQGQFTILNPNEVSKEETLKIIDTAFMLKGITYLETDMMIIVLTVSEAKQKGVEVRTSPQDGDMASSMQHRIIEIQHASPSQLREALSSLISENANVIADDRTRTLVITDTVSNLERLEAIIKQLDKPGIMDGIEVRVFQLQYLDARELSRDLDTILESLVQAQMAQSSSQRGRSYTQNARVEVMADRNTNSLIVTAPKEALDQLESFIQSLDSSASDRIVIKTFPLKFGQATQIEQTLNTLAQAKRNSFYRPMIASDSRTNTIIAAAYQEDIDTLAKLIVILDSDKSMDKETRVYMLENADAIVVKEMMQQLLSDENQSSRYSYYYSRRSSNQDQDIRIIEDQRLNAIIITAKPSEFQMIEQLVSDLDQPVPQSKEEPHVYPVKNVRASDLAYLINELFAQDQSNRYFYGQNQQQLTGLTGKVKILADQTTNSIIVIAGTPRAFGVVEKLIDELDRLAPEFGTTKVFRLKNADSEYLAQQLNELFEEDTSRNNNRGFYWFLSGNSQQDQNEFSQLVGNVRIVSETRTNSLLVTTNSQYFDSVKKLIEELDEEREQVLIEILIVELIDTNSNNIGIDWGGSVPISVQGTMNTNLNNINTNNAAIISSANFNAVIDYLSSKEKTNVVARPNILARDNQSAYVEVSTRVPIVKSISITNFGAQPEIEYEDVGLMLTVEPHINSATRVTVDVDLANGQVLDNYGLNSNGFTVPALSQRTVRTELSILNEETAVLSGVLDSTEVNVERGVPGLMHIPVLGSIFKTKTKRIAKTELVTFITPYILVDVNDRQELYQRHKERIGMLNQMEASKNNANVHFGEKSK
jgi:type II secretory pathway component GspD/PulD (secretin)